MTKDEGLGRPTTVATDLEADVADWAVEAIAGWKMTHDGRSKAIRRGRRWARIKAEGSRQ